MRLPLIPVSDTRQIILPLEQPVIPHSNLLNRHLQILFEENRIHHMPAIESPHRRTIVIMIRIPHQIIMPGIIRISKKSRAVSLLYRLSGLLHGEAP